MRGLGLIPTGGNIFTGRNEVVAKVMFLQVSVILSMGGSPENPPWTRQTNPPGTKEKPPRDQGEPPRDQGEPPRDQGEPPRTKESPLGPRRTPPDQGEPPQEADTPPGRRLQHTVNERPVRILLECILVSLYFLFSCILP